jgi:outer membrane protein TolC
MLRPLALTAAFLALSVPATAQGPMLTMDEAVARTLARNPATRAAAAGADEARARAREVTAGYLPRVDAVEGWQRGDHPVFVFSSSLGQRRFTAEQFAIDLLNNPEPLSNHRAALVVEQTIFDPGLAARTRGARAGVEIATLAGARVNADLRLAAVTAYAAAVAAHARYAAAGTAADAAAEDLRRTAARRDSGLETEANVLALRVHASAVAARRVQAEADESVARAELNALMREPLDALFVFPQLRPVDVSPDELPTLEARAIAGRPELREAAGRRTQAAAARTAARASLLPRVVAQAALEANGRSFGSRASAWAAGLELRWTLFNGGANLAQVQAAAAAEARLAADEETVRTRVLLDVRKAQAAHRAATARELTGRRMVEQARESQRIIRDRYDAGLASAGDLLRAADTIQQADADRIAALADLHVSLASLARAAGADGVNE